MKYKPEDAEDNKTYIEIVQAYSQNPFHILAPTPMVILRGNQQRLLFWRNRNRSVLLDGRWLNNKNLRQFLASLQ